MLLFITSSMLLNLNHYDEVPTSPNVGFRIDSSAIFSPNWAGFKQQPQVKKVAGCGFLG
jgi:hypothetical protein